MDTYEKNLIGNKRKEVLSYWDNRFKVPYDLKKKEYNELIKETSSHIKKLQDSLHYTKGNELWKQVLSDEIEDYITKNKKMKFLFKGSKKNILDIQKAKEYPINELLEFNNRGFVDCLWHGPERTPSLSWDKKRNKAHCFAGCGDFDSIDILLKINPNEDFISAVKKLCQT
jgi:hypothetical protein